MGLYAPYFPIFLNELGLSSTEIGILIGIPLMVRLFAGFITSSAADLSGNRALALTLFALGSAAFMALMTFASSFWLLVLLMLSCALLWTSVVPVTDAIAIDVCRRTGAKWGQVRTPGSLSFIVANLMGGVYLAQFGVATLPLLIALFLVLTGCVGLRLSDVRARHEQGASLQEPKDYGPRDWLTRRFVMGLVAVALVEGSHALLYARGSLHWQDLGYSSFYIGCLWAISVTAEVLLFLNAHRLPRTLTPIRLIVISAVVAVLRWSLFPYVTDPMLSLLLQLSHGVTFGAAYLGLMGWINAHTPSRWLASAQGLGATLISAVMAALTFSSGPLVAIYGIHVMGLAAFAAALGGILILCVSLGQEQSRPT